MTNDKRQGVCRPFRKRVPIEFLPLARGQTIQIDFPPLGSHRAFTVKALVGDEVKFSLRTKDRNAYKERKALAESAVLERLRQIKENNGDLPHSKIQTISHHVYDEYWFQNGDKVAKPHCVEAIIAFTKDSIKPHVPHWWDGIAGFDGSYRLASNDGERNAIVDSFFKAHPANDIRMEALESQFGAITSWLLHIRHIGITNHDRHRLLIEVKRRMEEAEASQEIKPAEFYLEPGAEKEFERYKSIIIKHEDYKRGKTDTVNYARVPRKRFRDDVTFTELFEQWIKEKPDRPINLVRTWGSVIKQIREFFGNDNVSRLTTENFHQWKNHSLASGEKHNNTLKNVHFVAMNRMLDLGVQHGLLDDNHLKSIRILSVDKSDESKLPYETDEVLLILREARRQTKPLLKYGPWLVALTGARASEITMLWEEQVCLDEGIAVIEIRRSRDGGTIKNWRSKRVVPIHPKIIEMGFLEFCKTREGRPLFYDRRKSLTTTHPATSLVTRQAEFIKTLGIDHERRSPNHAFRHHFKTTFRRLGLPTDLADVLQGHARDRDGLGYDHYSMREKLDAISKIPTPDMNPSLHY